MNSADTQTKAKPANAPILPLSGVRVLDLSAVVMGPYCTQILSDLGAEVTKVESLEGDIFRHIGPTRQPANSAMFLNINRGKRSIALNLNDTRSQIVLKKLVERSDVLVHSIRPSGIARMGLDYESMSAVQPGLIYCALLGFGLGGRYAGKPAYDDIIQAASGLVALEGEYRGTPGYAATVVADKVTALTAAYSIMAALLHREKTGIGQNVEVPMFETMVSFNLVEHLGGSICQEPIGRPVYGRIISKFRHPYKTKSGYISALVYTDRHFEKFCEMTGRADMRQDPRFTNVATRSANVNAYYELLEQEFSKRSAEEWVGLLEEAQIPVQAILSTDQLLQDPHLRDVGFFKEVDQPGYGKLRVPGFPVSFSETPTRTCGPAPLLGEHTVEILREVGIEEAEIMSLVHSGGAGAQVAGSYIRGE